MILLTDGVITFPAISVFNNYLVTTRSSNSFGIGEGRCKRIGGGATVASIADRDTRNYVLSALTRVEGWYSSEWLDREIFVYGSTNVANNGLLDNPRSQLLDNTSGKTFYTGVHTKERVSSYLDLSTYGVFIFRYQSYYNILEIMHVKDPYLSE